MCDQYRDSRLAGDQFEAGANFLQRAGPGELSLRKNADDLARFCRRGGLADRRGSVAGIHGDALEVLEAPSQNRQAEQPFRRHEADHAGAGQAKRNGVAVANMIADQDHSSLAWDVLFAMRFDAIKEPPKEQRQVTKRIKPQIRGRGFRCCFHVINMLLAVGRW